MPLPSVRNRTYAANDPVIAADLNAIQDCLIGAKHGDVEIDIGAVSGSPTAGAIACNANGQAAAAAAADRWPIPIDLPVGSRIKSVKVWYSRNNAGGGNLTLNLRYADMEALDATTNVAQQIDAATNGRTSHTFNNVNHTIAAGRRYDLEFIANAATSYISGIRITYDRP